jgi:voltage-gated potassium channel
MEREWIGTNASVLLTFAVAVLSIATGIVNIATASPLTGPYAQYVPDLVQQTAGFTGTFTGFLMLAAGFSLRRGYRVGWRGTMVLLPVTAGQGLLQASVFSYPLVVVSLVTFPIVALNRRHFSRDLSLSTNQLAALTALVAAQLYGTAGTYALREQFIGVDSVMDAFYYTLVTGSTVGYGDVTPETEVAMLFAISAILLSVSSFAVALGVLLTPAIEARLAKTLGRMTEAQLDLLEDHVIVLGYGELTEPILEELSGSDFVVVTEDEGATRRLTERNLTVLTADPSDEDVLLKVGIERARAVIAATSSDADDALAVLTARQLNPEVHVAAAATQRENVNKLKRAGADTVISPATIGGHLLAESAMGSTESEEKAEEILGEGDGRESDDD